MNDIELEVEVPESNTQEKQEEKSSVLSPKLDDLNHSDAVAMGETAEEKDVNLECGNSEQTGGRWNSSVVEPTSLLKDEKKGAEDVISISDVAATERGGSSELTNSIKADVGEFKAAVIVPDKGLDVVDETVNNIEEDPNTNVLFVIEDGKDGNDNMMKTVKEEGHGIEKALKEEGNMTKEEKAAVVTENDDEEPTVADEEKSLDTDLETDEEATIEEKVPTEDMETELPESAGKGGRGKRKRGGKNTKATPKSTPGPKKTIDEEDVCFICFDGGDLVLCDLRTCPKAYHPSCVNRDPSFFQTRGLWNCGWHLCSTCQKKADYMCYTCTFSLCKKCTRTNVILCLKDKEKKGFCETCMKTIMLIEKTPEENQVKVDFDDKNSWEYLFKDYWTDTKSKLNISLPDLLEAKNPRKRFGRNPAGDPAGTPAVHPEVGSGSENKDPPLQPKKKRIRNRKKTKQDKNTTWASNELLEFVTHMTGGDTSSKSQFDVQALLLEYIKKNKLRDSKRKSYIICDARLKLLFGKPRVGHFEMLKLLESHFLGNEDDYQMDDVEVDNDDDDDNNEGNETVKKNKKSKVKKKVDRELQSNREDYAAIDMHNISLIYMKRKLVEDLVKDRETFNKKVFGTFVRIRIPNSKNVNDMYRLVQVTGTIKTEEYSIGKQKTDSMLEILNLDKTESVSMDSISNQEFTEEECKRLRQSVKCGLIKRLKVGDILDKAMELQAAKVDDLLETEVLRLSHLRDRASDLGRKKELRECVEKLEILKKPEERARRLQDLPIIHDDPTMDPTHVSDESDENVKKQDMYESKIGLKFNKRRDYPSKEPWSSSTSSTTTSRSPYQNYESTHAPNKPEPHNENLLPQRRDTIVQQPIVPTKTEHSPPPKKEIPETTPPEENETEKTWHYKDPSGKIQGPFSMSQLRKWNDNNFFPVDLKIWKKSEKEDDGVLLTDALDGKFVKWVPQGNNLPSPTPSGGGARVVPEIVQPVVEKSVCGGSYGNVQLGFTQWGNVPNMIQTLAGNFLPPPPPPPQQPLPPPPPPPQQQNVSWQPGGSRNINWGHNVQGPPFTGTVNVNPTMVWGGSNLGWIPGQSQGLNGNPNWVGGPGPGPGNGNSGIGWGQGWGMNRDRNRDRERERGMWERGGSGFSGQKRNRSFHAQFYN